MHKTDLSSFNYESWIAIAIVKMAGVFEIGKAPPSRLKKGGTNGN